MEIYKVGESIDSFNYKQAQEDIVALLENGSNLVLDMSNCKYISSSGLRVLLYSKKVSASKGLTFSLVSVKPEVKEIMDITGFDNFFDIYATMTPAKEVGGDFYDFFLIDDDHLGMVMADVSGKGVPAALFMMMSKIIINNYAVQDGSPARVLEHANSIICKNNEEEMFVTVWLGVLEISTGKITAANAGHEYPIVRKADGTYELFKDKHGFVVGGMDGMRYKEYEIQLEKGGALFLYTDGVPEATNSENILFGTDRLIEALNRNKNSDPKQMLTNTKIAVDEFVGEAEQFDDLTMLALTWI